jgi:uncharacterized protein
MPADHRGDYFVCRLRGRDVAAIVSHHGAPAPPSAAWSTCVCAEDADTAAARVAGAGGNVIGKPFDSPGGGQLAVVADPAGAVFCLWQPEDRRGAQLVNEPGAWSMSALLTPDAEEARRFYGEVFGWEADPFDVGASVAWLWRLPGFVGGEPQQPAPRDVIAVMFPLPDGDASPAWGVDFWVADLDRALEAATRMGANVTRGPDHVPATGMRQAAITDPQGAPMSLTQPPGVP